ncbi:ABC transporter substrate-binding protein [Prosthecochloris sp. HL-130-GSB]|jgi:sulfonate transport system substrate-binding protein|uniref:ABC transporter substrate-binding protein n=1 Tax=Prosthecochloris sp. HL-130-GSB TaxID=1974213 RepID=UPI000A1C17BB|nr:ABC transporter substrate-binding protein [Prosthecochloris sp. HL-130-GSB]ARM30165.1 hypothetical protein B9H02_01010 [Prosthecochloris sp. HL-130-GSB]MBO8091756.1 ABC transporter substrate-binding protein [Prosthecochloris sp.]
MLHDTHNPQTGPAMTIMKLPVLLLLLSTALLSSCTTSSDSKPLRFAFQNRTGSALPVIAAEQDLFGKEGLSVQEFRFSSGPECFEALHTGAADIASMGDAAAVIALSRNDSFTLIGSHSSGEHRHRIMVRTGENMTTPVDLKGKKIGVKKGTSTYGALLKYLDKNNIDRASLKIIDLSPPTMTDALLSGAIDAFAASEPTPSAAEAKGAIQYATLGGLLNTYPVVLVARTEVLETRPDDVRKLMKALSRARIFLEVSPDSAAGIMSEVTGLGKHETSRSMSFHSYGLKLDEETITSLDETARFLLSQGTIQSVPDIPERSDAKFIPQLPTR